MSRRSGVASGGGGGGVSDHAQLSNVTANQHHSDDHVLNGVHHTVSGLTAGHVLKALTATTFGFGQLAHSSLGSVGVDDHHLRDHVLSGANHSASGLTAGQVLRAVDATSFAWSQLAHADLASVGVDDHHTRDHQSRHLQGGADQIVGTLDLGASGVLIQGSPAAATGAQRLANNMAQKWRNAANSGDIVGLQVDATDTLLIGTGAAAAVLGAASLAVGTTPATVGAVRVPHNNSVASRNQANSGNVELIKADFNSSNRVVVAPSGSDLVLQISGGKVGFFGTTPAVRQASAALTNNVTSGGTNDTIANFTDLTVYSNDASAIRNNIYQLARKVKEIGDALRLYGALS